MKTNKCYIWIELLCYVWLIYVSMFSLSSYSVHCTVTCMIMQKNGAGLHTASSCYWNNETDGSCTVSKQQCVVNRKNDEYAIESNHFHHNSFDLKWQNDMTYCNARFILKPFFQYVAWHMLLSLLWIIQFLSIIMNILTIWILFSLFCTQVRWENKTMYCIVSVFGLAL